MELTTIVIGGIIALTLVMFVAKWLQSSKLLVNKTLTTPKDQQTPLDKDALIREIATSTVAVIIVLGCFFLLGFVPSAPKEVVTLALGAILAFYFTNRQGSTKG